MLKGLEVSEIRWNQLENEFTLGSEYYAPEFLHVVRKIQESKLTQSSLAQCCELITDGDHGSADYCENGVLFILSEAVNEGWINQEACRYITEKHSKTLVRSQLAPRNVLLTKTGVYFGRSAVVPENIQKANTIAHVAKLVTKSDVNPFYLSTFFNCIYGYAQTRRRGIKATRPEIKLVEFADIIVALPSQAFQVKIEQQVQNGLDVQEQAKALQAKAENQLLAALGLDNWQPPQPLTYEYSSSAVWAAGRLDAEHFQPKYRSLISHLKNRRVGSVQLGDLCPNPVNGVEVREYEDKGVPYLRVGDIHHFSVDANSVKFIAADAAAREIEKVRLRVGDVLVSRSGSLAVIGVVKAD